MTPSACPVEHSFLLQASIHPLACIRVTRDKVAKPMFVFTNMKLVSGTDLRAEQLDFLVSVFGDTGGVPGRETESEWSA